MVKQTIFLIVIAFISTFLAVGQSTTKQTRRVSKKSQIVNKTKRVKTVSLGVLNGRATKLVLPVYTEAARAVNAYGQVEIHVVIDTDGKVRSAVILKGHPLLVTSARRAARRSEFEPVRLDGGELVLVNGVITYNFRRDRWNWFEIGYSLGGALGYYSIEYLADHLPNDLSREYRDRRQGSADDYEDSSIRQLSVASIRGYVSDNARSLWLFDVGLLLARMKTNCCRVDDDLKQQGDDLDVLKMSAPQGISKKLLDTMDRMVYLLRNPDKDTYDPIDGSILFRALYSMEVWFYAVGN